MNGNDNHGPAGHPVDVTTLPVIPVRANLGGTVVAIDGVTGKSQLRYVPGEHLRNTVGTIFGGYLAAIVDDAAGITAWFGGGKRRFATAQMTVNFLRPVKPGDELLADNTVVEITERQIVVDVSVRRTVDDKLVVTGRVHQTYLKVPPPIHA